MDACLPKDGDGNFITEREKSDVVHDLLAHLAREDAGDVAAPTIIVGLSNPGGEFIMKLDHIYLFMNWKDRISLDTKILVGKPVIKGTRLTVEFVIDLLANGWSEADIIINYPELTQEDIHACLCYASSLMKSERVYPTIMLQEGQNAATLRGDLPFDQEEETEDIALSLMKLSEISLRDFLAGEPDICTLV